MFPTLINIFSVVGLEMLRFFIFAIGCSSMAPLTFDVMVIRVLTIHPCFLCMSKLVVLFYVFLLDGYL